MACTILTQEEELIIIPTTETNTSTTLDDSLRSTITVHIRKRGKSNTLTYISIKGANKKGEKWKLWMIINT